jgi:hypothetical protein
MSQTHTPRANTQFFPRLINKTNISFNDEEMKLLNKGLKYNLHHKNRHWLSNLALEAETALALLFPHEQEPTRHQIAHNLQKLYKKYNGKQTPATIINEIKTVNRIKRKLSDAGAIVTEADKGSSMIIMYENEYNSNVHYFISSKNFEQAPHDPTKKLQRNIRTAVKDCKEVIPKESKLKYISVNLTTPRMRGLIKIHKTEFPIRPVVNWKNAPAYKLATKLVEVLHTHTPLPCAFNVKSTAQLINDLTDIPYDHNLRLTSFDITNMYTNIPTNELLDIINSVCNNNCIEGNLKHDILNLSKIIMDQNYFNFEYKTYLQHEGLAMGTPTSPILSEFYLQFIEN